MQSLKDQEDLVPFIAVLPSGDITILMKVGELVHTVKLTPEGEFVKSLPCRPWRLSLEDIKVVKPIPTKSPKESYVALSLTDRQVRWLRGVLQNFPWQLMGVEPSPEDKQTQEAIFNKLSHVLGISVEPPKSDDVPY